VEVGSVKVERQHFSLTVGEMEGGGVKGCERVSRELTHLNVYHID
jgi:hypothetical protein